MSLLHRAGVVLAILGLLLPLSILSNTEPATAALVSCDETSWTVATESELNQALTCYNTATAAGDYRITLENDIEGTTTIAAAASNVVFVPIEQAGSGLSLTVDGAGYGLTNSFLGAGRQNGIFAIQNTGDSLVVFENLTIGKSTDTGVVIENSSVAFRFSTIQDNIGAGIKVVSGSVRIQDSFIDDNIFGIEVEGGTVEVLNSIIQSHGLQAITITGDEDTAVHVDGSQIWSNDGQGIELRGPGFVSVLNSTFGANGLGGLSVSNIYATDGFMSITHSYIPAAIGPSITTRGNGHIVVKSSIVGERCGGFVVNLGPNLGECFGGEELELGGFADNGCTTPTPGGCVLTRALPEGSPAIGTGNCIDVAIYSPETKEFARQDVLTDQRGEARKPACDIGPFETEALPMCLGQVPTHYVVAGEAFVGTHGADVIFGTPGNDIIDGAGGDDLICGFDGDDVISGGDGDDVMTGGPGRDIVRGNPGNDTIEGGDGDDRLLGGTGDDTINGDAGDDYIGGFGGNDIIRGGDGNEKIYGGFGADVIFGHDGDDVIHGLIGDDVIEGGNGNDEIYGDRGNDAVRGGDGDDIVKGGNANDEVVGGPGNDELHGGKADDRIIGGLGTDLCIGNAQKIADTHTGCEETFGFP